MDNESRPAQHMKNPQHNSRIYIDDECPDSVLKILDLFGDTSQTVQCRIISTNGPYVEAEVSPANDPTVVGVTFIPHRYVLLIVTDIEEKALGFNRKP